MTTTEDIKCEEHGCNFHDEVIQYCQVRSLSTAVSVQTVIATLVVNV